MLAAREAHPRRIREDHVEARSEREALERVSPFERRGHALPREDGSRPAKTLAVLLEPVESHALPELPRRPVCREEERSPAARGVEDREIVSLEPPERGEREDPGNVLRGLHPAEDRGREGAHPVIL